MSSILKKVDYFYVYILFITIYHQKIQNKNSAYFRLYLLQTNKYNFTSNIIYYFQQAKSYFLNSF
jgi:hypothetical protein